VLLRRRLLRLWLLLLWRMLRLLLLGLGHQQSKRSQRRQLLLACVWPDHGGRKLHWLLRLLLLRPLQSLPFGSRPRT
jgi:hypothetical protein